MNRLFLLVILCLSNLTFLGQTQSDTTRIKELRELVVEGDTYLRKEDHLILFLSKENRNFGTNALDAISSLNRFKTGLNETSLTSLDNEDVYILINGVPADGTILRTYKSSDIKSLEYYPQAPAKYLAYTSGKVLNVILRKQYDRYYSGYFNLNNAVNTGFGTNQATLSYRDSLNMVTLNYLGDYRKVDDIEMHSNFFRTDKFASGFDENKQYKGALLKISAMYQRFVGYQLFNANLSFTGNRRKEKTTGIGNYNDCSDDFESFQSQQELHSNINSADLS